MSHDHERGEYTNLHRRQNVQRLRLRTEESKIQPKTVVKVNRKPVGARAMIIANCDEVVTRPYGLMRISVSGFQ